jgi:hypothetical protein
MALVNYEQVKDHFRHVGDDFQADIELKLEQATAMVITYLKRPNHGWTEATDPKSDPEFALVQAAILMQARDLDAHRGDETEAATTSVDVEAGNYLTAGVRRILYPLRDPSLA